MYNLLSGLERFGLEASVENITAEEVKMSAKADGEEETAAEGPKETDYLFLKSFECPICDAKFKFPVLKSGRARRMEPDVDLRSKCEHIDPYKYDTASCPKCGFTAMQRYFGHLLPTQRKIIQEQLCQKIQVFPVSEFKEIREIDYDTAIELYKLSLYGTIIKRGAMSEKAYSCLKISWLLRGKMEMLVADDIDKNKEEILRCRADYQSFYVQAFEGFVKAMSSENYPMCGMDQNTVDLLIAAMAYNLGKYDYASRFVSELIVSRTVGSNVKKRARDLKERISDKLKEQKQAMLKNQ